jgi:ferrous iron transport protein B
MNSEPVGSSEVPRVSPAVVLVGNPNTGKSTLFNALTGQRQQVANYPGVTVAKKTGQFLVDSVTWNVTDLPGTYSLVPQSPDEEITSAALRGDLLGVDFSLVVCVVDASNLRRNLYLATQVIELGFPTVVALTKLDLLENRGESIDVVRLGEVLQTPVVSLEVRRNRGLADLKLALVRLGEQRRTAEWSAVGRRNLTGSLSGAGDSSRPDTSTPTDARYAWIDQWAMPVVQGEGQSLALEERGPEPAGRSQPLAAGSSSRVPPVTKSASQRVGSPNWSDRIDPWLTHGLVGSAIFLLLMFAMFLTVFQIADPASQWVDWGRAHLDGWVLSVLPEGMFRDLVSEGIVGGVGNFVIFLPQIFVLFLFIGILESTGYLARAAYLMDRAFSPIGLSGKSFVPLLSSFACAVPGIMATRIIDSRRDRMLTIMVAPLMSCSARLPVYVLMTSALVSSDPWVQAVVLMAMYLTGVVVALLIVLIWKRMIWREKSPTFLLELPDFQWPDWTYVMRQTIERSGEFVVRAGTVILAVTILVWAANYFPRNDALVAPQLAEIARLEVEAAQALVASGLTSEPDLAAMSAAAARDEALLQLSLEVDARRQEHSYLGRAGKWIEPVVKPLGWDWRIGCAALASFPAREVIVTTLGILYQVDEPEEGSPELHQALQQATWPESDRPVFTIPVALSIMVFFALCSQCASTLAVIYQETKSWLWPFVSFAYMTALAYLGAFLTFQIGTLLGF